MFALMMLVACSESAPTFTEEDLRTLATHASDDDFTVPGNDVIKGRLDEYTGPRRAFVEASLARLAGVEGTIAPAIAAHGLPTELFAVALVESGFSDIAANPPQYPGAGVWQFIPSTARMYGLRVDDTVDERRDLVKATEAAMQLLGDMYAVFGDWGLAFAGYNQGHRAVLAAIEAEGTDDPWELIRRGALNPYAADVMAAVVVLEQPQALGF